MRRSDVLQGGALLLAAALGAGCVFLLRGHGGGDATAATTASATVADGRGSILAVGARSRIASTAWLADGILLELVGRQALVSVSEVAETPLDRLTAGLPRLRSLGDLETILALRPDLVVVNTVSSESGGIDRLREAGIAVCDLGEANGFEAYLGCVRLLGRLLQADAAAEALITRSRLRRDALAALAAPLPPERACFVALAGGQIYGGSTGTGYHDILVMAGYQDAAAGIYHAWPLYRPEDLLRLDPDVLVVKASSADALRAHPALANLRAIRQNRIISIDGGLIDDPGVHLLSAAEALLAQRRAQR